MKIRERYTCPLEIVHDIIKGKWKTIGIDYMVEHDMTDVLDQKGICYPPADDTYKKVGNLQLRIHAVS